MNKIKIEITYEGLETLCDLYDDVMHYHKKNPSEIQFDKGFKAIKNVLDLLFTQLKKDVISKKGKSTIKLSFKYFQAYFLINFISENILFVEGMYKQNSMLKLSREMHQEL